MTDRVKLSRDGVRHMAMLAMFLNHSAHGFLAPGGAAYFVCINIGYFTAPVMCWFLVRGFRKTRSFRNYLVRMLVFACLSQPIYSAYFGEPYQLDMLFTLSLCLVILYVRHSGQGLVMGVFLPAALVLCSAVCDWAFLAPLAVILFDVSYDRYGGKRDASVFLALAGLMFMLQCGGTYGVLTGLAGAMGPLAAGVCTLCLYDPEAVPRFRTGKYYFYVFYPAHLLVLLFLSGLGQA